MPTIVKESYDRLLEQQLNQRKLAPPVTWGSGTAPFTINTA